MQVRSSAHRRLSALSLADGGLVDKLKHRIFGRPAPAQPQAAQPARPASSATEPQPDPKTSARARLGGLNLDAIRRREQEAGLKDGGVVPRTGRIRGPGTGTSDSIPARMPVGSFVLPADSTEELADVRVSTGEASFAPEAVQRIGAAALLAMRDSTHQPARAARGTPGQQRLAAGGEVERQRPPSFGDAAAAARDPSVTAGASSPMASTPTAASAFAPQEASGSPISSPPAEAPASGLAHTIGDSTGGSRNSFGDQAAARLDSSVAQIPTTGYPLAPDGNRVDSSELSRNAHNAMMALPGAAPALAGSARVMSTVRGAAATGLGAMGLANTAGEVERTMSTPPAEPSVPEPPAAPGGSTPGREAGPGNGSTSDTPAGAPEPQVPKYDLSNGRDVGFGTRRFDGGSSPLFTNVPDAANNAALMGRGKISDQNMQAADALHQRENDRFRGQMAVEQYQREVAEAQAINSRPVYSTGESVGIRRDPRLVMSTLASNANYNRARGVDQRSQDRNIKREELNASLQKALNEESGRNMRARWQADLEGSRLSLDTEKAALDARSRMNTLREQDAFLNASTPQARNTAASNLRALAGQSSAPTYTVVSGARRTDGSTEGDRVLSSTGEWLEPPRPQRTPPAAAVEHLRRNPSMAKQFDQHYGDGASARILGR